jgi:LPXTG-motif cell wall-anchored protein
VTDGFAIGFGWLELLALLGMLGYFLLRRRR